MSDPGHDPASFPPPPVVPPPPGQPLFGGAGAPPPPPAYVPTAGMPPVGVPGYSAPSKPPRPEVRVGSILLVLGGLVMGLGSWLEWYTIGGEAIDGFFTDIEGTSNDGPAFVFFAVLAIGFGITQFVARRVLAVAILAVVFASIGVLIALADLGELSDLEERADLFEVDFSTGPGLWVVLLGSAVALAGAITTLARRRTWPTPV